MIVDKRLNCFPVIAGIALILGFIREWNSKNLDILELNFVEIEYRQHTAPEGIAIRIPG